MLPLHMDIEILAMNRKKARTEDDVVGSIRRVSLDTAVSLVHTRKPIEEVLRQGRLCQRCELSQPGRSGIAPPSLGRVSM